MKMHSAISQFRNSAILIAALAAIETSAQKAELKPIVVDQPEWGKGIQASSAQAVMENVGKTFVKYGNVAAGEKILVNNDKTPYPIALSAPAPGGERRIWLATSGTLWAQLAYQFAHEYCHTFTKHWLSPLDHKNMWFAESLCELASMWCMLKMGEDWTGGDAPFPNWVDYGQHLTSYCKTSPKTRGNSPRRRSSPGGCKPKCRNCAGTPATAPPTTSSPRNCSRSSSENREFGKRRPT